MATALSATYQAGTSTYPARHLLSVTGAPTLTPPYVSNFTSTVDGWTAGGTGTVTLYGGGPVPAVRMLSTPDVQTYFSRTVTGLTVGQTYKFSAMTKVNAGDISMGVQGKAFTSFKRPSGGTSTRVYMFNSFTATATSHVIQIVLRPAPTVATDYGDYYIDTVKVERTSSWAGTTIYRTDANGSLVKVREDLAGQDATGTSGSGTMTIYDYEAALFGPVSYTVVDGNSASAVAAVSSQVAPGVWLSLPASSDTVSNSATPPDFVSVLLVTDFNESSESNGSMHKIIGRADPISNPGPLAMRSGSFDVWCTDYDTAKDLRNMLSGGDVALLRQPTFDGMDVYFVATDVRIRPEEVTATQRWIASVTYQEVAKP